VEYCIADTKCSEVVKCRADIDNLTGWQKSQNGAIHRVEANVVEMDKKFDAKFDKLLYWIMAQLAATIIGGAAILLRG